MVLARHLLRPRAEKHSVFLNIPYDTPFQNLCLAYIAGISAFGLVARATLEISESERRLDRILKLLQRCKYSIHDLSRVELTRGHHPTPRFNMPFELGLAVTWQKLGREHRWYVFESRARRIQKSLSDLNGTDVRIHNGTIPGVFRELRNVFIRPRQPTVQQMIRIYADLQATLPAILRQSGSKTIYTASVFKDLSLRARSQQLRVQGLV